MPREVSVSGPDAPVRYPLSARILHWAVAIGVLVQVVLGWASELSSDRETSRCLIHLHYQLGMLLLALMVVRSGRRLFGGIPALESGRQRWRRPLAATVHALLYLLLFVLPMSGYVIWVWMGASMEVFGMLHVPRLFSPPADDETWRAAAWYVHYWAGWVLLGLVALHVAAAFWHQFVRRDGLITRRML